MRIKNGMLVAVDGVDGCGKSTTISSLIKLICRHHIAVCYAKSTTITKMGRNIKQMILNPYLNMNKSEQATMFAIARADAIQEVILPALLKNKLVICDRSIFSSLAYQGKYKNKNGKVKELTHVISINKSAAYPYYIIPALYVYINLPTVKNVKRLRDRNRKLDAIDKKLTNLNNMKKLKHQFALAQTQLHAPCLNISGELSSKERGKIVFDIIEKYIKKNHLQTWLDNKQVNSGLPVSFDLYNKNNVFSNFSI